MGGFIICFFRCLVFGLEGGRKWRGGDGRWIRGWGAYKEGEGRG